MGLTLSGYKLTDDHVYLASLAYVLALVIFLLGMQFLRGSRWKVITRFVLSVSAILVLVLCEYHWIKNYLTPTFLYLVPTHELVDCERRAFFVNHSGLKDLQNVEVVIRDDRSGSVQTENFLEIDSGPQNPDAPRYIWVKPSHPWDEEYTITVSGKKFRSVQKMVMHSVKQKAQFAVQINVDQRKNPVASCRDSLLPGSNSLGSGSRKNCDDIMAVDPRFLNKLQPEPFGLQQPNGSFSVLRVRELPQAYDLDAESEDRHLTEYQRTIMTSRLSKYRRAKLLVLYAGGPKSLAYATEFHNFFRSLKWDVTGPKFVPSGDERLVDVQVSVSSRFWNKPNPRAADLLGSLEGVKYRKKYVFDDAIPPDLIVLWVGPKSPNNLKPDACAPASVRPRPGELHTCEIVAQTESVCPFPPQ